MKHLAEGGSGITCPWRARSVPQVLEIAKSGNFLNTAKILIAKYF